MFELDTQKSWVDSRPEEVVFLSSSINRSMVAPPDRAPEAAQAFIAALLHEGAYHVYIYLHLTSTNAGLLYRWDEGGVAANIVPVLQQTAMDFTGSMGFMMNDMRFRKLTAEQQYQMYHSTPMFFQDLSVFAQEEVIEEDEESGLVIEPVEGESVEELSIDQLTEPVEQSISNEVVEEITIAGDGEMEVGGLAPHEIAIVQEEPAIEEVMLGGGEVEQIPEQPSEEDVILGSLEMTEEPVAPAAIEPPAPAAAAVQQMPIEQAPVTNDGSAAEIELESFPEGGAVAQPESMPEELSFEQQPDMQIETVEQSPVIEMTPQPEAPLRAVEEPPSQIEVMAEPEPVMEIQEEPQIVQEAEPVAETAIETAVMMEEESAQPVEMPEPELQIAQPAAEMPTPDEPEAAVFDEQILEEPESQTYETAQPEALEEPEPTPFIEPQPEAYAPQPAEEIAPGQIFSAVNEVATVGPLTAAVPEDNVDVLVRLLVML